ncbi:hypothetical protein J2751_001726 [Halorubrum alkaliphilum]|uniref:KEOPS complex Pcc1-like subunit n=1 Tax=Halorubrum alkaliphilum TaxID=261290 RepID=A0A8T4GHW4_9EURY|nr:KEOPS complex subunit Pcc1 [Halorubrum alkaliphilum]MBP1922712.1 hypothetical protein [Halorubrum alkaliphilum]
MSDDPKGSETTADPTERSEPTRTATVHTTHADAGVVAAALAPDDTESMSVAVDGDTIEARIERPTTGGVRSTVDDYIVNLRVADRVIESTETNGETTNEETTNATNTNANDTTYTNT